MSKLIVIPLLALILLSIDLYVFQAVKVAFQDRTPEVRNIIHWLYWGINAGSIAALFAYHFVIPEVLGVHTRQFIMAWLFMWYFAKIIVVVFLLIDDLIRLGKWVYYRLASPEPVETPASPGAEVADGANKISRSEFLAKTGIVVATAPIVAMSYGILSGAHDYRVRRKTITLPNLPASFNGLKIVQISDVHSGSFFNKTAVQGGVEMLLAEKPDIVFFTGDLVNNVASEMKDYFDIFSRITAPLGVYSVLGNHDYGDYVQWPSAEAKRKNLLTLIDTHRRMGWDILINENRILERNGDKLAILGVENWGAKAGFPQYGKLDKAYRGTEDAAIKLLLSHDPSHWDAEIRPLYRDIDVTFAGHTHGMQFGIEIGNFRWSPSKYVYTQWADLYEQDNQYLYVNRGFGYLGFPGRIGILPEITVIELKNS